MSKTSVLFLVLFVALVASVNLCESKKEVGFYEIRKGDFSVKFTNWGATIVSVFVPDNKGKVNDVVLGYDTVGQYTNDTTYFGAIVGRVANRIGGAQFSINGTIYYVVANEGNNTLHGGHRGFGDVIWTVKDHKEDGYEPYITFTYNSFDGEQGFPGNLLVSVTYMILGENKLFVTMKAKAVDQATPVNLADHTYWNLGGHDSGDILSHHVKIFGSRITPVDNQLIPTGEILSVKGTAYDFAAPQMVGSRIDQLPNGYDINYALDENPGHLLRPAAVVHDGKSGRKLELWTNKPGLQFYTSNMFKEVKGKGGFIYKTHAALCLETQGFPDSVNHPNFPSQIVTPGETYKHYMLYRFTAS